MQHIGIGIGMGLMVIMLLGSCGKSNSKDGPSEKQSTKRTVIQNKGSDTLINVAQKWAEAYATVNPDVAVAVTGGGSGTGISALLNGTADIANTSRKMKDKEIETAEKNGITPVEHVVGFDALTVFVHKDNPLAEATIEQLSKIYKEGGKIEKWSELGVKVPGCDSDKIIRISRQNSSGTYDYFKHIDPDNENEYKLGSRDMHGSKDVVKIVETTPCAIGYSGLAYAANVKKLCVKGTDDASCIAPSAATARDGSYPIARPLMMVTGGSPKGEIKKYMDWIMSRDGQCLISKIGYAPVKDVTCE